MSKLVIRKRRMAGKKEDTGVNGAEGRGGVGGGVGEGRERNAGGRIGSEEVELLLHSEVEPRRHGHGGGWFGISTLGTRPILPLTI